MAGDSALTPRLSREDILRQQESLRTSFPLEEVFSRLDLIVLLLNRQRQIVERYPLDAFGHSQGLEETLGLRPGEALGCIHSTTGPDGCGTGKACRLCGVVQAVEECFEEQIPVKRRCMLRTGKPGAKFEGAEYQVTTVPFPWADEKFVLLYFEDRSEENRRLMMERLFFHDVLNTASGLKLSLELLERKEMPADIREDVHKLIGVSQSLLNEIGDQKTLAGAENGTLQLRRDFIHSTEMLAMLCHEFAGVAERRGVALEIAPFSEVFSLISDAGLLERVLGNMVKNAIEASQKGELVILTCSDAKEGPRFMVRNMAVIDEDVALHIFTRSFSTKGENRGFGTYSMKLLGESYLGGSVTFTSRAGEGTEFSITFSKS